MRMGQMGMGGKSILWPSLFLFVLLSSFTKSVHFLSRLILLASYLETQS